MLSMLVKLRNNETPRDLSLAGLELGGPRTRILSNHVAVNSTLMCLHLSRKGIADVDGVEIAKMLLTNKTLRKLELEGNLLSINSATEFGNALAKNTTLIYLDLEANQLTQDGPAKEPMIKSFIPALKNNKTLLSLNLASNTLTKELGEDFAECIKANKTIIDF